MHVDLVTECGVIERSPYFQPISRPLRCRPRASAPHGIVSQLREERDPLATHATSSFGLIGIVDLDINGRIRLRHIEFHAPSESSQPSFMRTTFTGSLMRSLNTQPFCVLPKRFQ